MKNIIHLLSAYCLLLSTANLQAQAVWIPKTGSQLPSGAYFSGIENQGGVVTKLYVAVVDYEGLPHIGKTWSGNPYVNIGWGGTEKTLNTNMKVLGGSNLAWQTFMGTLPGNVIKVTYENTYQCPCRGMYQGGLHPGKTMPGWSSCNIGYGGQEVLLPDFEVMVDVSVEREVGRGDRVPLNTTLRKNEYFLLQQASEPNPAFNDGSDYYYAGKLILQNDGNLVWYDTGGKGMQPWATCTNGNDVDRAVFQSDGNLVLYSSKNTVVWATNTHNRGADGLRFRTSANLTLDPKINLFVMKGWGTIDDFRICEKG